MQCSVYEQNTLLLICPLLGKSVPEKQPCWWRVLTALPFFSLQSTLHSTESSCEGQSCGVLLMVTVNFWQICRADSSSVFISWCSYYHYLSLDHDSFWVPVEPHCAKYYTSTCLALLSWLHSSRPAYSCISCLAILIFSCSTKGMFKTLRRGEWGKWSDKIIYLLILNWPCSTLHCTDRKTGLVLCWSATIPAYAVSCHKPTDFCRICKAERCCGAFNFRDEALVSLQVCHLFGAHAESLWCELNQFHLLFPIRVCCKILKTGPLLADVVKRIFPDGGFSHAQNVLDNVLLLN